MTVTDLYIEKVKVINAAKTEDEHSRLRLEVRAWAEGVRDAGGHIYLMDGDYHYIEQGIDRPMCCGIWLDWEPSNSTTEP